MIDLRSDTVTQPTPAMRQAMAQAQVGDDVYEEDLTIQELESTGADILGKEAALFVPSGTMANLLAVLAVCQRGDEIIMEERMHMFLYEVAGIAALGGVQIRTLPGKDGLPSPQQLQEAIRVDNIHFPSTRMFCMETSHNMGGGICPSLSDMQGLSKIARDADLWVHIDGARIFNAAQSLGVQPRELANTADSLMFCLSKGLAAPVGSLLLGPKDFILRARKYRKMVGGGMRQAGVLAAAGLIALGEMRHRLGEDHENAKKLAQGLKELGAELDLEGVQTNIIRFSISGCAHEFVSRLKEHGVLANATGPHSIRFVTHYQISSDDITRVLQICKDRI